MSTVLVTGANRGIDLGFVRQLLSRPKVRYPLIIAATRTEPSGELRDLLDGHEGRLKNVLLGDLADEAAVLSAVDEIGNYAAAGVNILINNACRTTQPTLRFPSIEAANELRQQLLTNAYGPALLTCSLFSKGLLTPPPGAPPNKPNYPIADLSSIHTVGGVPKEEHAAPTTAPHHHRDGEVDVPIVVNIWSTQGDLRWTGEIWEGGSTRDDLVFHPIYAASKVALSGVTMHLAREMRNDAIVNCIHPGWVRTEHARRYAPLSTDQSASKVIDVIETWRTTKDSGQWLNEEGQKVPF